MAGERSAGEVTALLERWSNGEPAAIDQLAPLVYDGLRRIAGGLLRRERAGHTLQATALVNETFQKLLDVRRVALTDRAHFFTFSAKLMRRILIDYARRMRREKRGPLEKLPLDPELAWVGAGDAENLDLSSALEDLEAFDSEKAHAVQLRYFLGCTVEETAELLNVSRSTVDRDVRFSLAWLRDRLHRT